MAKKSRVNETDGRILAQAWLYGELAQLFIARMETTPNKSEIVRTAIEKLLKSDSGVPVTFCGLAACDDATLRTFLDVASRGKIELQQLLRLVLAIVAKFFAEASPDLDALEMLEATTRAWVVYRPLMLVIPKFEADLAHVREEAIRFADRIRALNSQRRLFDENAPITQSSEE